MNTINQTYIDALLADAAYVDVIQGMSVDDLVIALKERMTPTLAAYIAANFEVVSMRNERDIPLIGSGFDATFGASRWAQSWLSPYGHVVQRREWLVSD